MRKLFLPLALFVQIAFAQKPFNGLGMLQIGTDTSMIYNYAIKMHTKVVVTDNSEAVLKGNLENNPKVIIYRLTANPDKSKNRPSTNYCPGVAQFYISKYDTAGMTMKGITINFYKNKLFAVECALAKSMVDYMNLQYGKSKATIISTPTTCTGADGRPLKGETFSTGWLQAEVKAGMKMRRDYDKDCKPIVEGTFFYGAITDEIVACQEASKK